MLKPAPSDPGGGKNPDAGAPAEVLKSCAIALAVTLGLAVVAGFERIWSQFAAANAPLELLWPFVRPLAAIAVETAFLVGIPVGLAAAAFRLLPPTAVHRGDAYRAFVASALPVALALSAVSVVTALAADPGTDRPGRLAAELVEQARRGCLETDAPKEIEVPLVKVRWLCTEKVPRVTGKAPIGRAASFSASAIQLNEDLTRIRLRDLTLDAGATPRLKVTAREASISGLRPWGRPQRMPPLARGALLSACALGAALLVALVVIGAGARSRAEPWLTGALVAAALWGTLSSLDRGDSGFFAYAILPFAALGAALGAAVLSRAVKRVARRWVRC